MRLATGLGTAQATKTDDFLEKLQTAFDLSTLIFGKLFCNLFPEKALDKSPKSAA